MALVWILNTVSVFSFQFIVIIVFMLQYYTLLLTDSNS